MVVALYAAFLAFWYVFLISQVIRVRMSIKGKIQGKESKNLAYAVKAHAAFSEYVPLPLILLLILEMQEPNKFFLNCLCIMLCISRALHSLSLLFIEKLFNNTKLRMLATGLTVLVIILTAFSNIVLFFASAKSDSIVEIL